MFDPNPVALSNTPGTTPPAACTRSPTSHSRKRTIQPKGTVCWMVSWRDQLCPSPTSLLQHFEKLKVYPQLLGDSIDWKKMMIWLKNGHIPFCFWLFNAYIRVNSFQKRNVKSPLTSTSNESLPNWPGPSRAQTRLAKRRFGGLELDLHSAIHGFWEDDANICVGASSPIISNLHHVHTFVSSPEAKKKSILFQICQRTFCCRLKLLISQVHQNTIF